MTGLHNIHPPGTIFCYIRESFAAHYLFATYIQKRPAKAFVLNSAQEFEVPEPIHRLYDEIMRNM